jgi:hypothetical protein
MELLLLFDESNPNRRVLEVAVAELISAKAHAAAAEPGDEEGERVGVLPKIQIRLVPVREEGGTFFLSFLMLTCLFVLISMVQSQLRIR